MKKNILFFLICFLLTGFGIDLLAQCNAPVITLQPVDVIVCNNGTTVFTVSATDATSYQWCWSGSSSANNAIPPVSRPWSGYNSNRLTITSVGSGVAGQYWVRVTNSCGTVISRVVNLTIGQPPLIASNSGVACAGGTVRLNASSEFTNYSWRGPNGFSSTIENPELVNLSTNMFGEYTVTATGCSGVVVSAKTTVSQGATPMITSQPMNVIACNGGGAVFSVSATGVSNYQWYWRAEGGSDQIVPPVSQAWSGGNTNQLTVSSANPSTSGTYWVKVSNACGIATSNSAILYVPRSALRASVSNTLCVGGAINLEATSGFTSYTWTGPNNFTSSSRMPSITNATIAMSGTYTVTATDSYGCSHSANVNVNVNQLPVFSLAYNAPACRDWPLYLNGPSGMTSYSWTGPDGFTSMLQNPTVTSNATPAMAGTYTLVATATTGCSNKASVAVEIKPRCASGTLNYITSRTILTGGILTDEKVDALPAESLQESITYFDGIGRPIQTVVTEGSPEKQDLIQPVVYDERGREHKKYLPFVSGVGGAYKEVTFDVSGNYAGVAANTYGNNSYDGIAQDSRPFNETAFEESPLNRPLEQTGAGKAWKDAERKIKYKYITNSDGTSADTERIVVWKINATSGMPERDLSINNGYYSSVSLFINSTFDEEGNEVREYRDGEGKVILKKVQATVSAQVGNDNHWALTYYIYDNFNNLVCVIQPEGVSRINEYFNAADDAARNSFLSRWAFRYTYDARKRMITKQVPGAEVVYMVYDNRDRLVLTQDGNQRANNLWTFTKYDDLNRPIATGIKDTTAAFTPTEMQLGVNNHYAKSWAKYGDTYIGAADKNVHGYSNFSYPTVTTAKTVDPNRYLAVTYYDNYTFKSQYGSGYDYINDGLKETVNGYLYEQPANEFASVIGQVTGTKVKVLDGGIAGGVAGGYTWLKSVNYYDDKYRVIQTISDNYKGGTDRVSNLYDFVGKVLQSKGLHVESDVQWTDLVLNTVIGNYLQKTGSSGWTSGAASVQSLPAGQDGWMEFVASEENTARMVGLSTVNNGVSYTTIDYAIHPRTNKTVAVYEKGSPTEIGTYASGDVFRIARVGTTIKYYKNGFLKHTSSVPSTGPLLVDVSMNTTGSTVVGVKSSFSTSIHSVLRRYVYDHAGRLMKMFHTLDNGPEVLLASNDYNELGQLIDKGLHSVNGSAPMQSVDYRYNIRGWLTSINNSQLSNDPLSNDDAGDFFGMNLAYSEELGTGNTQSTFTNTGLVSSYTFSGNASDAVANGLNGTVYGAQLTTDSQGNSNSAYNFTANDYIDIPNSKDRHSFIQNTGIFTISAFVKIDDLNGRNIIVSSTSTSLAKGFTLMYETYGGIYGDHQLRFSATNGQSGQVVIALGGVRTINDNNWHHVAAVGDGKYVTLYVDGVQDGSPTPVTTFASGSATSTTLIGKTRSNTNTLSLGMVGAIDELNIFNRSLSKSEIGALARRIPFNTTLDEGQYNGNISAMKWSVNQGMGDIKEMAYNFKYDALNRLTSADNLQSSSLGVWASGKYHERDLTYDLNGNIKSLTRSSELGMIDNLVYDYGNGSTQSNKLLSVADRTTDTTIKSKGFIDANTTGNDYNYDVNGNMTVDLNKGLSSPITYNYLNLPEVVTRTGNTIRYIYDASGRKLSQVVRAGFGIKQTDYAGEFVYEDDMLRFINHEEGRIVMSSEKLLYKHEGETLEGMTALNSTLSVITVNGEKYVNATSGGTGSGILPIGNAIDVVPGEKYLIRIKGYRSNYNAGIMIRRNKTTISYGSYLPALVSNEAWMEQIYVVPPNTSVLEIGVGWPVPTGTAGLNVNAFELIRLESAAPEYQYNLKDHLGNVRLTFTTKQDIETKTATLEDENAEEEDGQFLRYKNARIVKHYLFDRTKGSKPAQVDGGAQRLSGRTNEVYGLAKSLSVMPGDVINMEVYAKYIDPNETNRTAALNTLIMQIAAGTAPGTTVVDGRSYVASTSSFPFPADATQNTSSSSAASPKAFLSWLVYDRNYTLIPSKSGFRQMSSNAKEDGSDVAHELLSGTVTITEPGYIYVFLSNEQGANPYEVYFDDFKVEQAKSPVVQSEEYYPFGLAYNNYQRENSVDQKYLYNGKELQDELNLGWLDYGSRMYMPEIGRFNRPDIFSITSESCSVYSYAGNDPVNFIDMGGNFKFSAEFRSTYPRVTAWLEQVLPLLQNNQHIINAIDNHTHLGRNVIKKDFQNGNGPTLSPQTPFDSDAWGTTVDIGDIRINQKNLIDLLERGLATNDSKYKDFTDLHKFMTIATILHELIHEGSRRTGFKRSVGYHSNNPDQDEGDNWEIEAFGRMVDRVYKTGGKSDNPRTKDSAESFREDNPVFFYLFINTTPSGNGESKKKKKPDADREAKKRSG